MYKLLLIIPLSLASSLLSAQTLDESLRQRFLREAPARWKEYAAWTDKAQGNYRLEQTSLIGNGRRIDAYEYKANEHCQAVKDAVLENRSNGKTLATGEQLFVTNPTYAFELKRETNKPWVVAGVTDLKNGTPSDEAKRHFSTRPYSVECLVRIYGLPLSDLSSQPNFRITGARTVSSDNLAEIIFECPHEVKNPSDHPIQKGTLVLDPARSWSIRSFEVEEKSPQSWGTRKFTLEEMAEPSPGFPIAKRASEVDEWTFPGNAHNRRETRWQFDLQEPTTLPPDSDFTLTAFGFPEPYGAPPVSQPRWYLWFAGGGIALVILGIALRRFFYRPETVTS